MSIKKYIEKPWVNSLALMVMFLIIYFGVHGISGTTLLTSFVVIGLIAFVFVLLFGLKLFTGRWRK